MKRIAIIICSLLLLLVTLVWTIYTVRKSKIEKQYVSNQSTSVLSIAVDDLLLDNISTFVSESKKQKGIESEETWIKKIFWDAGISIPARLFLFSIPPRKTQFYGILAIENYDDCFLFFTKEYPKGVNFINKEQGIVSVEINKHIKVLFDRNNLIYTIAIEENLGFEDLQSILQHTDSWTTIGSFKEFEHALAKKHINYIHKDRALKIEASVAEHKIQIDGEWQLSQNIDPNLQVRTLDTINQTVSLWSLLPLKDMPILSYLMSKYTGLSTEQLNSNYANYFDLQIKDNHTIQKDTSIAYVYDDDFNAIEEIKIQESRVPNITHTWKYHKALAESLPNKMFYKFRKKRIGQYLLNTTSDKFADHINNNQTLHPFYCFIDFETWPDEWTVSSLKKLKENKVKATIMTKLHDKNKLSINGQITY